MPILRLAGKASIRQRPVNSALGITNSHYPHRYDMRLGVLKSLGHNIADSFASGVGLMIGVYEMNVFAEAAAETEGFILVDFLAGTTSGTNVSDSLRRAVALYRDSLPRLCAKHGFDSADIRQLQARFGTDPVHGPQFTVTVESHQGKTSTDRYVGIPGKRLRSRRSRLNPGVLATR